MSPRWLVVIGTAAVVFVFIVPPVGLVLGIITIVAASRQMRATRPQPQQLMTPDGIPVTVRVAQPGRISAVFGLVLGTAATALGALLVVLLIALWPEVRAYTQCHDQTNTTQGEERCKTAFKNAVLNKFGQ